MPFRKNVDPIILAYIDANMRMSNTDRILGYIPQSYVNLAVAELAAMEPPDQDPYKADNDAFAAEVAKLKSMTIAERKAYNRAQQMEAALNAYRRQRERDAAAGKPPVTRLEPL